MEIHEFVKQSRDMGLPYAILRNWKQPTPHWREFEEISTDADTRIDLANKSYSNSFKEFESEANKTYPKMSYNFYVYRSNSYRNQNKMGAGTSLHFDENEILHFQCRGVTIWLFGDVIEDPEKEHSHNGIWNGKPSEILLEPGDIVWLNERTWHQTINMTEKRSLIYEPFTVTNEGHTNYNHWNGKAYEALNKQLIVG